MKLSLFVSLFLLCISLSAQSEKEEIIQKLKSLEGYSVTITEGITEGPDHKYLHFTPEIKAHFTSKSKASCLSPRLELYPIALKDTIHSRLIKRTRLRSDFYPPSPDVFYTKNYIVFAWEFESYDNKVCCNCEKLRYAIIRDLNLKGDLNRLISRIFDEDELEYTDVQLQSIIEQLLNLLDLQQYFHIEEDPNRLPLVLEQTSIVQASRLKGLKKFGQDVRILERNDIYQQQLKNYLLIDKWFIQKDLLTIQLHYKTEGVFAEVRFEKVRDEWQIKSQSISEY